MPTPAKGKRAYLALGTSGSETAIHTYLDSIQFGRGAEKIDITTYGPSDWEESMPGILTGTLSGSGNWNATIDAIMEPLFGVAGKAFVLGPEGNASTKRKYSGEAYLSKYDVKPDVKGKTSFDWEITITGTVTAAAFS